MEIRWVGDRVAIIPMANRNVPACGAEADQVEQLFRTYHAGGATLWVRDRWRQVSHWKLHGLRRALKCRSFF